MSDTIWNSLISNEKQQTIPTQIIQQFNQPTINWKEIGHILTLPAPIDWCEQNYNIHTSIAEFWNTISNITFLIVGIYAFRQCFKYQLSLHFYLLSCSIISCNFMENKKNTL
jgi:hypothetical protein